MSASNRGSTPWLEDADVTLYHGDVLATLRELPAESVDCVVTSPPYWGLRDYGQEGQLGLESTPEQYVERMVEVFREVRRVLAPHGTVWCNLGDSFQDKQLVGVPWKVAFALQADGWYLRSDIIWSKPNPMPESVTDRPTKAHEYVFLLSKQPRYFFDQEAVREKAEWARWGDQTNGKHEGSGSAAGWIGDKTKDELQKRNPTWVERKAAGATRGNLAFGENVGTGTQRGVHGAGVSHDLGNPAQGRNIRSVWEIATQPYPEAHFATFPEELARRCIAAGCPEWVCRTCGVPRMRIVEQRVDGSRHVSPKDANPNRNDGDPNSRSWESSRLHSQYFDYHRETRGFTHCAHSTIAANLRPGIVLDPFMGSGTVAHVARKLGRHAVGIDLNSSYLELAARRLQQQSLFAEAL